MFVTHDGAFHADDVFATAALQIIDPGATIARTRDPELILRAEIAYDVGGGAYDHHQPGGNGARPNGIPYAAFGLIWRRYGQELCGDAEVAAEVDRQLVQPIDAHDNGVTLCTPSHETRHVTVSHVISNFNPAWDEPQDFDGQFWQAVRFASAVLERAIVRARGVVLARTEIADAVHAARMSADDDRIILLHRFVPWQEALCEASAEALYIVYPSAGSWRCQGVPVAPGQPGVRKPLPMVWAGLDGTALQTLTGIDDATFAHRARFIAGAQTMDGALALARIAVGAD